MLIYRLFKKIQKWEASQLHSDSNCKHLLNFTCHAHKIEGMQLRHDQNVVEVTQTFYCVYITICMEDKPLAAKLGVIISFLG